MNLFSKNRSAQVTFRRKNFSVLLLILLLLSLAGLSSLIYFLPPGQTYDLFFLHLSVMLAFFPLVFCFFFCLGTLIFRSKFHGTLIASFVTIYLLFRLNNLTHPFFLILLAALFLTLELMVANRRD